MALSSEERTLLHERFTHSIGHDGATLVMSQFPVDEAHEPATKDFVRAELALTRSELRSEIGDLRTELRTEIGDLRTELHREFRKQTTWFVGLMIGCMTVISAVVHAAR